MRKDRESQPCAAPHASAAAATAYEKSAALQARSSGARRARQRVATRPESRSAIRAAAKASSVSTRLSVLGSPSSIVRLATMAGRRYLFTPGPTPVPPQVLAALAEPVLHHRGVDFRPVYERCLGRLREVFRTESDVFLYTGSGTAAMESVGVNLCEQGTRALVVSAGNFGERWEQIAALQGATVEAMRYEWGEAPRAEDVAARLRELGGADVVFLTHSETSTGVVADLPALAAAAREADALVAVDAVSSLGALPLEMDAWGLDAVASGSQKALMTPPGLALCAVSPQAL